jgi:hypothetical protein
MSLFQRQENRKHVLYSLLITLSLTYPLSRSHVKNIVRGFVGNERFYVSNQKTRGYLKEKEDCLILSPKAKRLVKSLPLELVVSKNGGEGRIRHEALLLRSLFLCLLHLQFSQIIEIRKQKRLENSSLIPDLILITDKGTLFIEVETGKQKVRSIASKIRKYKIDANNGTLIYFAYSENIPKHFLQDDFVQFINLQSHSLSEEIEKIVSKADQSVCLSEKEVIKESGDLPHLHTNPAYDYEKMRLELEEILNGEDSDSSNSSSQNAHQDSFEFPPEKTD